MKIGVCVCWQDRDKLEAAVAAGVDFVEFSLNTFEDADEGQVASVAAYLKENGVAVRSFNGMFPWRGMRVTGEGVDYDRIREYLENVLSRTDIFKAPYVVFGSSGARKMQEGDRRGTAQAQILRLFEECVIPAFEKHNRIMVIEPLNEDNLINTVADGMMYVNILKHPCVKVLADFYHAGMLGENIASYPRFAGDLLHCHIAGVKSGRHAPLPTDGDDDFYTLCFRTLEKMGYDGGVSIEGAWGEDYTEEVSASVAYLRSIH